MDPSPLQPHSAEQQREDGNGVERVGQRVAAADLADVPPALAGAGCEQPGTWMQTVAAQWLIVSASGSVALVSLVQTASTLPVVLLAAPAGVLADVLDRRRVLVGVQLVMVGVAAVLAVMTF